MTFEVDPFNTIHQGYVSKFLQKEVILNVPPQDLKVRADSSSTGFASSPNVKSIVNISYSRLSTGEYQALVDVSLDATIGTPFQEFFGKTLMIDVNLVIDTLTANGGTQLDPESLVVIIDASDVCEQVVSLSNLLKITDGIGRASMRLCGIGKGYGLKIGFRYRAVWVPGGNQNLDGNFWYSLLVTGFGTTVAGVRPLSMREELDDFEVV